MATQANQETATSRLSRSVVESDAKFRDGVCSGYLTYYDEYRNKPLTDIDVHDFLIENITDAEGTNQFNAGYCTGWIEALIEDREILYSPTNRGGI